MANRVKKLVQHLQPPPHELSSIAARLRSGDLDLVEHLDTYLDTVERLDGDIKAVVSGTLSRGRLYRECRQLVERFPDPAKRPPLFGIPVGIKDIISTHGIATRYGSHLPVEKLIPEIDVDADCVVRLRRAGALVACKTATTEFAFTAPAATRNPHDLERTPGGSSSGSAAGVAAGMYPFALGTQTIGSMVRPASFCGVVAFKPSFGRVDTRGVYPVSRRLDHLGIFARCVSDLDLIAPVLVKGWKPAAAASVASNTLPSTANVKFCVPEGSYLNMASSRTLAHFNSHADKLAASGFRVERIPRLFNDIEALKADQLLLARAEMSREHPWSNQFFNLYRAETREHIQIGQNVNNQVLATHLHARQDLFKKRVADLMDKHKVDFWIAPSAIDVAPRGINSTGDSAMNGIWTLAGLPVISVPMSPTPGEGLPLGMQIIGREGHDEQLVDVCKQVEKAFGA